MVVHDLKNPVSGIAMLTQLALRKGQDLPEGHRGYLRQIDRTCHEMMRLIQNLLDKSASFSRRARCPWCTSRSPSPSSPTRS